MGFSYLGIDNATLIVILGLMLIIIPLRFYYLAQKRCISKSINSLNSSIELIANGDLEKTIKQDIKGEAGILASSLEKMRIKLKKTIDNYNVNWEEKESIYKSRGEKVEEITTLYKVSSLVNSILDLEELLRAAAEEVCLTFKAEYGAMSLWNEGKHILEDRAHFYNFEYGNKTVETNKIGERTFKKREPIMEVELGETHMFRSSIGVPLIVKDKLIGILELHHRKPAAFTENDLGLLIIVVSQIAMAVENAKLYLRISEDLQKRLEELGGLYFASQLLSSSLHFQTVLEILVDLALQLLFADSAAISILDEEKEEHRLMASRGLEDEFVKRFAQRKGEGLGGRVIENGAPLWVNNVEEETRFDLPQVHQAGVKAVLAVPIKIEDNPIGCIFVSYKEPHKFEEDEIKLLTALANQSAIIIRNARLYSKVLEEKAVLDSILYSMGDGVMTLDRHFKITSFNRSAELITGWESNDVIGLHCQKVFCKEEVNETLELALEVGLYQTPSTEEPPKTHEVIIVTKDGSSKCILLSPSPLTDGIGNVVGVVTIFKDVTRLKETEQMKTNFLTTVSHELRTPLTSIKGYIATLLHPKANFPHDIQKKFLGIMEREADRLGRLISDLLDVSRIESKKLEIHPLLTNLVELVRRKVEMERSRLPEQYSMHLDLLESELFVNADVHYLEYVLEHLFSNAVKYSPKGGKISISLWSENETAHVSVRDWGIGIPFDQQDKVFDRFYRVDNRPTRSAYGPGLGLFIAKRIVESHRGRIWVESVYKEGSTFTFTLPLANKEPKEEART